MEQPPFRIGDSVRLRSARNRVGVIAGEPRQLAGDWWYPVVFASGDRQNVLQFDLERAGSGRDVYTLLKEGAFGTKETLSKLITQTKLTEPLQNYIYAFLASRTQFFEYQLKPLVKFLESPTRRLLIADEVGLGKTIEAGLILIEQRAREPLHRVLVVCTSSLREKWQRELRTRFDEDFEIANRERVQQLLRQLDEYGDGVQFKIITSLQTMRGRGLLDELEARTPLLDLVIVDEAHHMRNPGTLTHRLGRALSDATEAMLFLTATPIHLGNENLFYLLHILDPNEFDNQVLFEQRLRANEFVVMAERGLRGASPSLSDSAELLRRVEATPERARFLANPLYEECLRKLETYDSRRRDHLIEIQRDISQLNLLAHILTRSRKREVQEKPPLRNPQVIPVEFTPAEMEFYEAVTELAIARCQARAGSYITMFATMMPQRQAASCIPATIAKYLGPDAAGVGLDGETDGGYEPDDSGEDGEEEAPPVPPEVVEAMRRLCEAARAVRDIDSKFDALLATLRNLDRAEPDRKLVIFSYFKSTLAYLARRLAGEGYRCEVLTGDVPSNPIIPEEDERGQLIARFKDDPTIRILLSSEVGSEGLDFQFCHILVNYDLPWNPMVVEQRIGRLDRIGQESDRILIFNLSVRHTIEDRILRRLYARIRIFEQSIGDLEDILGEEIRRLTMDLLRSHLTPEEQERRIALAADAIERKRQLQAELEEKSSGFLGHDAFFSEEIGRVRSLRRYLSSGEIEVFVREFLQMIHPRCLLVPDSPEGVYDLVVSPELERQIRSAIASDDILLRQFLPKIQRRHVQVTFESAVAYDHPTIEFLNGHHPLVRTIRRHYLDHQDELYPVAGVILPDAPGRDEFLYLIFLVSTQGVRAGRGLEAMFVRTRDGMVLDADLSEMMLAKMVTAGKTLVDPPTSDPSHMADLIARGEEGFALRLAERKRDLQMSNEALVNSRLASLEQSFESCVRRKEEQLERARQEKKPAHYIRLLEGTIRNKKADYGERRREIEEMRSAAVGFELVAGGLLRTGDWQ